MRNQCQYLHMQTRMPVKLNQIKSHFDPGYCRRRDKNVLSTGTRTKVAAVDESSPPMTAIANGWNIREPTAGLTATGIKAKIVVIAVIRIGRRRMEAAVLRESDIV